MLVAAGCGSSSSSSSIRQPSGAPVNGGTLHGGIPDNPDHLDTGLSYAVEGWEILEATNNGLLTFKKASGPAGSEVVPDMATAMPAVTDGGRTYTFHLKPGIMFSAPVNRAVKPSDFQYSIERLFHIGSPGVGFYTADCRGRRLCRAQGGAHLAASWPTTRPTPSPSTWCIPTARSSTSWRCRSPSRCRPGTPYKDISTDPAARVATGPYQISSYIPHQQIVLTRNPAFKQWSPNAPDGHLNQVNITIGVTPEQAVNETAQGQLDWYMEAVPVDRLTQLKAQYPARSTCIRETTSPTSR